MSKPFLSILPLVLFVALIFGTWVSYIFYIDVGVPHSDQYPMVIKYINIMEGNESWLSLWERKGGHRLFGYHLMFFLNLHWLGFSPKLEILIALALYFGVVIYLVNLFAREHSGLFKIIFIFFAVLLMTCAQTIRLSSYSLIATRLMDFAGFIFLTSLIYNLVFLENKRTIPINSLIKIGLAFFVFILLFGRGWGMAACASIIACLVFLLVTERHSLSKIQANRVFTGIGLTLVAMGIYFYGFGSAAATGTSSNLGQIPNFYLSKLGTALTGMFDQDQTKNPVLYYSLSFLYLIATTTICLNFMIKGRMKKADFMALFLIFFSLAACALISLKRNDVSPFFYRHNFEVSIGILGILYFSTKWIAKRQNIVKFVSAGLMTLGAIAICMGTYELYSKSGFQKNYHAKMRVSFENNPGNTVSAKAKYREIRCFLSAQKCNEAIRTIKHRAEVRQK